MLPEGVGSLAKLEVLELSGCCLEGGARAASPLRQLVSVHADDNALTSLEGIRFKKLGRLRRPQRFRNRIEELPDLGECASLQTLNVGENALTTVPSGLERLEEEAGKLLAAENPIKDPVSRKPEEGGEGRQGPEGALKWIAKNAGGGGKGGKKRASAEARPETEKVQSSRQRSARLPGDGCVGTMGSVWGEGGGWDSSVPWKKSSVLRLLAVYWVQVAGRNLVGTLGRKARLKRG